MTMTMIISDPVSIFEGGRLALRTSKIQNLYDKTYMDIQEHSKEVCRRPAAALEEKGQLCIRFSGRWFVRLMIRSGK